VSLRPFELALAGGPWNRRRAREYAWLDQLPWDERLPADADDARIVWTRTAFSEYASAAAFAEISSALCAAGAPIDLIAAAGEFVAEEIAHTELAARIAAALGGAVALEVDLERLVRPPAPGSPLVRAAELLVRTSCVGESLTLPILKLTRQVAGSTLIEEGLARVIADESAHAQLGWWFLDWAEPRLDAVARDHLGRVAGATLRAFAPLLGRPPGMGSTADPIRIDAKPPLRAGGCSGGGTGVLGCDQYDPALADAATQRVARPLAARDIHIPDADLAALGAATPARRETSSSGVASA
jgi:hypothetical protein